MLHTTVPTSSPGRRALTLQDINTSTTSQTQAGCKQVWEASVGQTVKINLQSPALGYMGSNGLLRRVFHGLTIQSAATCNALPMKMPSGCPHPSGQSFGSSVSRVTFRVKTMPIQTCSAWGTPQR